MAYTRDEVLAAAGAAFQGSDLVDMLAALDRYGAQPHERERERVQLAIIELSAGSKEKLLQYVQAAKLDYRDVLAWQELGPLGEAEGTRLRDAARALIEKWGRK
jgi:hypothetical protein